MTNARTALMFSRPARTLQVLALALGTTLAGAQTASSLPRSTVETISVNSGQRAEIESYVNNWSQRVNSDDAQDVKRAMEALTEPLHERGVTIAFRQAYAQLVMPIIDDMADSGSVQGQMNALRLAGDLATPRAALKIRSMFNNDDAGVQLFAISNAGRVLQSIGVHGPSMSIADANALINEINEAAADNMDNIELTRTCARALTEGTRISSRDLADVRNNAIVALSDLVGSHLRSVVGSDDPSFAQSLALDAASALTQAMSDISAQINADAARASVRLGGDIIAVPLRQVIANSIPDTDDRDSTIKSVQSGETLLYFARRKAVELDGKSSVGINTTDFSTMLSEGEDRDFRNEAASLLSPGGALKDFGFADDQFLF